MNERYVSFAFLMPTEVQEAYALLSQPESPVALKETYSTFYTMSSRNPLLDNFFVLTCPDSDLMEADIHTAAQQALGFNAKSSLSYSCNYTPKKGEEFLRIGRFLDEANIPFYLTLTDEEGNETIAQGNNPLTGVQIAAKNLENLLE